MSDRSSLASRNIGACDTLFGLGESLENVTTTTLDDGCLCYVTAEHKHYELHRDSVAASNPPLVIVPIGGPGRWVPATGGSQGQQGFQGAQGAQGTGGGAQGAQGAPGVQGFQGAQGFQGVGGAQGFQGAQGTIGAQGSQGFQGTQGATGVQGFQGTQGATGVQGFQGTQGATGVQGFQGAQGSQGFQGATGIVAQANIYLIGQTAAIGATSVFGSIPAAGLYRISAYLDVVTAGGAGTLSTRINFTPDDATASFSIATSPLPVTAVGGASGSVIVETAGVAQITYEVDAALFTAGSLSYSLRIVGERLTP